MVLRSFVNGISDGKVMRSLQPASTGSPTLIKKPIAERAPTVVSPSVRYKLTSLNEAQSVAESDISIVSLLESI